VISLETDRLILRNFRSDDWESLLDLAIRYQATEWAQYDHPWPTSAQEVQSMANWLASGDDYAAACLKATGQLVGLISMGRREEAQRRAHNLGYVFHPDFHGQGYATEGCRAAMDYLFGQLAADEVRTGTHPANEPSVRLLRRLGLKEVAEGEYAISREEWLALARDDRP
jgi:ribosomal-protein-alanine N-acetyltransferase